MSISFDTLKTLPPPDVIKVTDYDTILQRMRARALQLKPDLAGFIDLESEPVRVLLEAAAYETTILLARVNDAARANLLPFATGGDLDQLAVFYDVTRMAGEDDDRFRRRTILHIAGRSPGGTEERYRAAAMDASIDVRDAVVWGNRTQPLVNVAVLSNGPSGAAGPVLVNIVEAALNNSSVRMVNDTIVVRSAVAVVQDIEAKIWLTPNTPRSVFNNLPSVLAAAWERDGGIGRDLTRSWIVAQLMQPGVYKVQITTPGVDIVLEPHEALALGEITLDLQGREF